MRKVAFTNTTASFAHVGGVMIPPGDTRDVDARLVPGYQAEAAGAEPVVPADPLALVLAGKVAEVVAGLEALDDDELDRLMVLEAESDRPRKGVLEAAQTLLLARAAARLDGAGEGGEGSEGGDEGEGGN